MSAAVSLQGDLLLAAFADPVRAVPAWARWQSGSDWERYMDFESYLLLPRVYHNLGGRGVDDALFQRLKGVVKRNWLANAATLAAIARIAGVLEKAGIAAVLLPPCALLLHDRSTALEADTPIAYQIARRDAQRAIRLLRDQGWRFVSGGVPHWRLSGYIAASSRIKLRDGNAAVLELQWSDTAEGIVIGSTVRNLHGQALRSPGIRASIRILLGDAGLGSELCRVSRALLLLEKAPDNEAWRYLLQQLQQRGSPLFRVVADLAPASTMPGDAVSARNSVAGEGLATVAAAERSMTFLRRLARPWRVYRSALGSEFSIVQALYYLPGYLMGKWDLQHVSEMLPSAYRALRYHWRQRS